MLQGCSLGSRSQQWIWTVAHYVKLRRPALRVYMMSMGRFRFRLAHGCFDRSLIAISLFRHPKASPDSFDISTSQQGTRKERRVQTRVRPLSLCRIRLLANRACFYFSLYHHDHLSFYGVGVWRRKLKFVFFKKVSLKFCSVISFHMNRSYLHS